jgi:tetratricopeptide (TPR) repeat protein
MLVIPIAFQPQGRLLAVSNALLYTRLYDRETGRNVANLTHSLTESAHPCWLSFSPDGTQLAVVRSGHDVRIWDLAVLNAELAELGLDEEGLPQRPITQRHAAGHSRSLTVDRGQQLVAPDDWYTLFHELALNEARKNNWPDAITNLKSALQQPKCPTGRVRAELLALRGNYHHYNGDLRAAQDDWHEAIRLAPDLKGAVRSLARLLTLGPAEHRDAGRSFSLIVPLANASQPEPDDLLILAAAQLRLGNNEHALDVLRRVGHLPDIQPYAALLISMAKANLGMLDDANGWYQQAAVEIARRRSTDKELDRLLKEASTLVDLSRQADRERAP